MRDVVALDNEDCDVHQLKRHLDGLISIREHHRKILADSKSNWLTDYRLSCPRNPAAEALITERSSNNLKLDGRAATKIIALKLVYYFS